MRQTLISKATRILLVCLIFGPYSPHAARAGPKPTDPIQTAQEALAIFQSANDQAGIARSYTLIGQYHYAQNSLTESTQYYDSALQLWRQQHNVPEEADALIMLGYIEGRKGEWLNGVSYLTQALNLVDEQDDPANMGRFVSGMGSIFNEIGLPENGLTQYQRSTQYYGQAKSYRYYTRSFMLTGYTYYLLKDYPAALTHLQEALYGLVSLGDLATALDLAQCHEHMGRVYIATD